MPIYRNGIKMYKNINVEISGIMKEIYASCKYWKCWCKKEADYF